MDEGWIKVHHKMLEWEWFKDRYTLQLFMFLLLSVDNNDREYKGMKVKAGSYVTNIPTLVDTLDMSENYVRRSIKNLIDTGEIEVESEKGNSRYRVFTVKNWRKYQIAPQTVNLTDYCPANCEPHNLRPANCEPQTAPHTVQGSLPLEKDKRKKDENNARVNEPQTVNLTDCGAVGDGSKKTDSDIPSTPYNPSQGYGAPPIIPYPRNAKEVMVTAALRGIAMTEAEANDFINYYGGLGWMVKNSPIRNWTMFLQKWHENSKNRSMNNGNPRQQRFDTKYVPRPDEYGEGDEY